MCAQHTAHYNMCVGALFVRVVVALLTGSVCAATVTIVQSQWFPQFPRYNRRTSRFRHAAHIAPSRSYFFVGVTSASKESIKTLARPFKYYCVFLVFFFQLPSILVFHSRYRYFCDSRINKKQVEYIIFVCC